MYNPCTIELNREALRFNCERVRELAPQANILAMVKANGYGHGARWVATQIKDLVDGFGVARFEEAVELRRELPDSRLLLLGNLANPALFRDCFREKLDLVIADFPAVKMLAETLEQSVDQNTAIRLWLKLNIGMNRLGMTTQEFEQAHTLLEATGKITELLHMSHFSASEETDHSLTNRQAAKLLELSARLGQYPRSLANSAAVICHPRTHREWVRPGIMLYGDDPTGLLSGTKQLQAVMHFKSRIIALRDVAEGEGVGYNHRWRAQEPRLIATVAAGYADGYPRTAPDGTPVVINGQRCPLAGRVSMDLLTVDVSDLENVQIGDEVTLWGQELSAAEVARHCQTISYELFTRITSRVQRVYINEAVPAASST